MINIKIFINSFLKLIKNEFGSRIWFAGLQGSYARGEADENSDIDVVVILDNLTVYDIERYNQLLDSIPERKLMCGFISGKNELLKWNASELFQFYYDTKPLIGSLDELLMLLDNESVNNAIYAGACTVYHACVHNMLFERDLQILKGLYKSAVFILQAICFKQTGRYVSDKADLLKLLRKEDKLILISFSAIKSGEKIDFKKTSELLFDWSKDIIINKGEKK